MIRSCVVVVTFFLFLGCASAAPAESLATEQYTAEAGCYENLTPTCALAEYKALDAQLNNFYRRQLALLKDSADEKRLLDAQRAWLRYVEADCLYEVGTPQEAESNWAFGSNVCKSAHLKQRIEKLKAYLLCESEECDSEYDTAALPTEVNTLVVGRETVISNGGGILRKRRTGALVRFGNEERVRPGDLLLLKRSTSLRVNKNTIVGGPAGHWFQIR
jgi:uncharacterized protein YecT (DUF1311 family)